NRDGPGVTPTPIATPVDLDGVQIRYFPCPLIKRLYWAPALGRTLHHAIGKLDIVHLHSVFLWPTLAAARAARGAGVPYILSPRGMLVDDLIRRKSSLAKRAWIALFERRNIQEAAAVHLTSEIEASELRALRLRCGRLAVVANGIELPDCEQLKGSSDAIFASGTRRPYVLFLGRLNWKKGLDRLIPAMAQVANTDLLIAGN